MNKLISFFDSNKPLESALTESRSELHKSIIEFTGEHQEHDKIKVLYVDDEKQNLISFRANFRNVFSVFTTSDPKEAEKIIAATDIDVVICDQVMPGIEGIQLLAKIREKHPYTKRILISAYTNMKLASEAINVAKVSAILEKPWNDKDLELQIQKAYSE